MKDELGNRIKEYEMVSNIKLMRKAYTIIRLDGKSFSKYTKHLERPFDLGFVEDMDNTAKYLCKNIQNAKFAFVQSDEITILMTDFENMNTNPWFDNKIQKIVSVSASMATAKFNQLRTIRIYNEGVKSSDIGEYIALAEFDSRVFQVPSKMEVFNTLLWRQQDTTKNSITSVANTMFSHNELKNKNGKEKQEMIFQKSGINWNDYDPKLKRGRMIVKEEYEVIHEKYGPSNRNRWVSVAPPIFTQDKEYLNNLIPDM